MSAPIDAPDDVSLQPSDRYLTPSWITDKIRLVHPGGIDLDPFHDPHGSTGAKLMIDAREGGNAYRDPWPGVVVFANGPYSGRYPQRTAERCAWARAQGKQVWNLCPAAVGSDYWRRLVWPWATAIVWLGRLGFAPAVDVHANDGRLVCPAGKAQGGNRTEIAMVAAVDCPERVRDVFSDRAHVTVISR